MFENYREMSDEERARVKSAHKAVRAHAASRYGNLAWGFVRGFPYRRIERTTRVQKLYGGEVVHHNLPDARTLTNFLAALIPGFAGADAARPWATKPSPEIEAWLADPGGAIPAPVREKKPWKPAELAGTRVA